jgi:hypothetical protein
LKVVMMPKLLPPPRRAQYRSGKVFWLTVRMTPDAVTSSNEAILSHARPYSLVW